jgi:hypothetical protein
LRYSAAFELSAGRASQRPVLARWREMKKADPWRQDRLVGREKAA